MAAGHVFICVSHCGLHFPSIFFCSLPFPLFALCFCSVSGQRLIRPNPWQCLARDAGSVAAALMHCGEHVSVRALGRRWDASHVIVYLPFHFQMALSRKNVVLDTHPLSMPLSFSLLGSVLNLSRGSLCCFGVGFRSRTRSVRRREEAVRETGRQTGTWEEAIESQVVV